MRIRSAALILALCLGFSCPLVAASKKPITLKQVRSGSFRMLQRRTGTGVSNLLNLYQMSGARSYKDFSTALMVGLNLKFNPQIILLSLHEKKLKEILVDLGIRKKRAKEAIRIARRQLKDADRNWEKRRSRR